MLTTVMLSACAAFCTGVEGRPGGVVGEGVRGQRQVARTDRDELRDLRDGGGFGGADDHQQGSGGGAVEGR